MTKRIIITVALIAFTILARATPFITRWDMSKLGYLPNEISFGVGTTGTVSYTWTTVPAGSSGSGTFSGTTATITSLPTNAIIRLTIDSANFNQYKSLTSNIDNNRLIDVEQWGTINWSSMENAFYGCTNLNISAIDIPNLKKVTNMSGMFSDCDSLNGPININNWDVSNVTTMSFMFSNAYKFNQSIENWNTSNVLDMSDMFYYAISFNQPIGNWNISKVWSLEEMFFNATSFNQPIGNWNTSNVTLILNMFYMASSFNQPIGKWKMGMVTNMRGLFFGATSFNQPIGNWNISNVNDISYMFYKATSFNQSLSSWNLSSIVILNKMFDSCGMDCSNYSSTLNAWANNSLTPNSLNLGAQNIQYGSNAIADRNTLINTKHWTINGDIVTTASCYPLSIPTTTLQNTQSTFYPNPATNSTSIDLYTNNNEPATIKVYNTLGKLVYETKFTTQANKTTYTLPTNQLASSVYMVSIVMGSEVMNKKLKIE